MWHLDLSVYLSATVHQNEVPVTLFGRFLSTRVSSFALNLIDIY